MDEIPTISLETDARLLERFKGGSQEAFGELCGRHVDGVYSAALRQVGDSHLAEDVTQGVFLILWQKADRVRAGGVVAAWLLRVTGYCAANARRVRVNRRYHEERAAAMAPERVTELEEERERERVAGVIDEAVNGLPEGEREVIILRYFEGKGHAEIGAALGVSEEAVAKRSQRGVKRLRGILAQVGGGTAAGGLAMRVHAAPGHLVTAIVSRAPASAPVAVIVRGATKMMKWSTVGLVISGTVVVLAGAVGAAVTATRPAEAGTGVVDAVQMKLLSSGAGERFGNYVPQSIELGQQRPGTVKKVPGDLSARGMGRC